MRKFKKNMLHTFVLTVLSLSYLLCSTLIAIPENTAQYRVRLTPTEVHELELQKVMAALSRTQTHFGREELYILLCTPTTNVALLEKRQQLIKTLATNEALYQELQTALKNIAETESAMHLYFDPDNKFHYVINQLYASNSLLKKIADHSSSTLQGWHFYSLFTTGFQLLLNFGGLGLLRESVLFLEGRKPRFNFIDALLWSFGARVAQHSWTARDFSSEQRVEDQNPGLFTLIHKAYPKNIYDKLLIPHPVLPTPPQWLAVMLAFLPTLAYDFHFINTATQIKNRSIALVQLTATLQQHCVKVARFIEACQTVIAILEKCNVSTTDLFIDQKTLLDHEKVKEAIELLKNNTFKEGRTFFFHHGRVLYTHKLLLEHAHKFFPLLQFIGSLDAYFSIATLYRENQTGEHPIALAQYDTIAKKTYIDAADAWLALLPETSVKQPITIGVQNNSQKMLITGPNLGGKSAYLKMVGLTVLLAQTWGVVPASHCILTPFSHIKSCLDPMGDISKGLSKFGMQKLIMSQFATLIEQCTEKGNFGLFLIDEAFNGTVEDEASRRIVEFGQKVAVNPHTIVLITTHFEHPTTLERVTNKKFMNYHIEIIPENDSFRRTFYLRPGPAIWWFKDQAQRRRYIDLMDVKLE